MSSTTAVEAVRPLGLVLVAAGAAVGAVAFVGGGAATVGAGLVAVFGGPLGAEGRGVEVVRAWAGVVDVFGGGLAAFEARRVAVACALFSPAASSRRLRACQAP